MKQYSLALVCCLLACSPETSKPSRSRHDALSTGVVISEVYGGGNTATSAYRNDYVVLFNRSAAAVNVSGWSVQYASDTGGGWQVTTLGTFGNLQPGRYLLVRMGSAGTVGQALPAHDVSGGSAMSATAGKVALVNSSTALSGVCPAASTYVDLVGYGTTANCAEGGPTGNTSPTTSVSRIANGCTETDSNLNDFTVSGPLPRNSMSPANLCGAITVDAGCLTMSNFITSLTVGGYAPLAQTTYGEHRSVVGADGGTDLITLEAYFGFGLTIPATEIFNASSAFDFCEVCPSLSRGCNSSGMGCAREYFAQSGSASVTVATENAAMGRFTGSTTAIRFVEWDFNNDVPVPGGECVDLGAQTFDVNWGPATGGGGGSATGGGTGGGSVTGGGGGSVTGGGGGSVTGGGGGSATGGGSGGGTVTGGGAGGGSGGGSSGTDGGQTEMDAGVGGGGGSGKLGGMSGCGCTSGGEASLALLFFALLRRRR